MRSFLIIWGGQVASMIGTSMTRFALLVWAWESIKAGVVHDAKALLEQVREEVAAAKAAEAAAGSTETP